MAISVTLPPSTGIIKSAVGLGILLSEGIGDTVRVSLTAKPEEEVRVAYAILNSLGLRKRGIDIISCPTCGRCRIDLKGLVKKVENMGKKLQDPLTIAVMGCVVNGPGEAREADYGIAGGKGRGILFKKVKIVRRVREEELLNVLFAEINSRKDDS